MPPDARSIWASSVGSSPCHALCAAIYRIRNERLAASARGTRRRAVRSRLRRGAPRASVVGNGQGRDGTVRVAGRSASRRSITSTRSGMGGPRRGSAPGRACRRPGLRARHCTDARRVAPPVMCSTSPERGERLFLARADRDDHPRKMPDALQAAAKLCAIIGLAGEHGELLGHTRRPLRTPRSGGHDQRCGASRHRA